MKKLCVVSAVVLGTVMVGTPANAQAAKQSATQPGEQSQPQTYAEKFSEYQVIWKMPLGYRHASLRISGGGIRIDKQFDQEDKLFIDSFNENLKEGEYTFSIRFTPEEFFRHREEASGLEARIERLTQKRLAAMQTRDKSKAKRLYQEIKRESERLSKSRSSLQTRDFQMINRFGSFSVDSDGRLKQLPNSIIERARQSQGKNKDVRRDRDRQTDSLLY